MDICAQFAYKLPGMKWTSAIVSKILTYTWSFITLLLKAPPFMMKLNLPMLPHSKFIRLATGMKMNLGLFSVGERGYNMERCLTSAKVYEKTKTLWPSGSRMSRW